MSTCGPPGGLKKCADNPGFVKNANGSILRCDCGLYVHAWSCNDGSAVDFWMTLEDAQTIGDNQKFSYHVTDPTDPLYLGGPVEANCFCLFFALNMNYSDRPTSYETVAFHHEPESTHTPAEVSVQEMTVAGFEYTPDTDTSTTPAGVCGYNHEVEGELTCSECANDCGHRVACASYTVSFHLKIEIWDGVLDPDTMTIGPNPHSCIGDDTAPADHTGEDDFTFTVSVNPTSPSFDQKCHPASIVEDNQTLNVDGTNYSIGQVQVTASCDHDSILISIPLLFPTIPQMLRDRAATIEGAYDDEIDCLQIDSERVVRSSITGVSVTCDEGI